MATSYHPGTAKIYQFPVRDRATGGPVDEVRAATHVAMAPAVGPAFGGGWYHDEAVREAERLRTNLIHFPT